MCLVKYLTVTFSVGSPVEIKNPDTTIQAQLPQIRDKSKMHSICSTPELAEREKFLRWV